MIQWAVGCFAGKNWSTKLDKSETFTYGYILDMIGSEVEEVQGELMIPVNISGVLPEIRIGAWSTEVVYTNLR